MNPNLLGLVSGLLLLMGAFGVFGPSLAYRAPVALVGVVGLLQAQSIASTVATSVALTLGLAFMVPPARRILATRTLRAATVLCFAILLAYGLTSVFRPADLPTSESFSDSSAGQRTVLAAAGLEVAERNPVVGVGWRRSEEPEIIGDPEVNRELRARFRGTKNEYFPNISPTSVHNAYVQVLADLGLIGFALFLSMLGSLAYAIKKLLGHGVPRGTPGGRSSGSWHGPSCWSRSGGTTTPLRGAGRNRDIRNLCRRHRGPRSHAIGVAAIPSLLRATATAWPQAARQPPRQSEE